MSIIRRWQRSCYKRMLKARLVTPKVVVLMDGGICSQMLQYLLGEFFRKRGCKVVYDLSFYKEWGSDMDYKFARNFDLLKVKPDSVSPIPLSVWEMRKRFGSIWSFFRWKDKT